MHLRRMPLLLVLFLLCSTLWVSNASAQEKGDVGFTTGYPADIGLIWHATARLALESAVSFAKGWGNSSISTSTSTTDTRSVGLEVSGRLLLDNHDHLSVYVRPGLSYSKITNDGTFASPGFAGLIGATTTTTTSSAHATAGTLSLGAQYALSSRFSAFGEAGGSYLHGTIEIAGSSSGTSHIDSNVLGTQTRIGVIFYF